MPGGQEEGRKAVCREEVTPARAVAHLLKNLGKAGGEIASSRRDVPPSWVPPDTGAQAGRCCGDELVSKTYPDTGT